MATGGVAQPERLRIEIQGVVQGVGFRPFAYRLATALVLTGWVANDTRGICIEVEGWRPTLSCFLERLRIELPSQARIDVLTTAWLEPVGYKDFEIRHSGVRGIKTVVVLPDLAACTDCLSEAFDVTDRRYLYPFTNCTNCGPRFSIVRDLPYDRPNTTMQRFQMCPDCLAEYHTPDNRRFHAQPNACDACGPHLSLRTSTGTTQAVGIEALNLTARALRAGEIVAVKGLGGFHLMADASNATAVTRLRVLKQRDQKPLAIMVRHLSQARSLCDIPPNADEHLASPASPILLLPQRSGAPVAENVAPGNPNLGVMLPYTPLHHLLLRQLDFPIVATSGNRSDEPICIDEQEACQRLGHITNLFLIHDRPIERHVDDSVAWVVQGELRLLRRARGYAPLPVRVDAALPSVLAVGAHLKNTIALNVGSQVFLSQHIGDLETPEALMAFERVIDDFLRLYDARPVAIACDLHPDYVSTRWAREKADQEHLRLISVQHHHAHLAACMAEHGVRDQTLGVTWDGTGYGPDGTVWGGEFLLGTPLEVTRVAHVRPFRLPGGTAAVREPCRVALALLWEIEGEAALQREELASVQAFCPAQRKLLAQMLARTVNAPLTTSAGRLFDAIAALVGLHQRVTFEGQAAMALEYAVVRDVTEAYPLTVQADPAITRSPHSPLVLDWQPLVEGVLDDLRRGVSPGVIAARFHNALVEAILAAVQNIGVSRVALTGGCFQNRLLTEQTTRRLRQAGCEVLLHRQVPPNDGGISFGQVAVAAAQLSS